MCVGSVVSLSALREQDKKIERLAPVLETDEEAPLSKLGDDPGIIGRGHRDSGFANAWRAGDDAGALVERCGNHAGDLVLPPNGKRFGNNKLDAVDAVWGGT